MAGIGDAQHEVLARRHWRMFTRIRLAHRRPRGADHELAAAGHRVARVEREVDHRLLDLSRIPEHRQRPARQLGLDLDVCAEQPRQQPRDRGDRLVEIEHARLEQLFAAERQQLTRHRSGAFGGAPNLLDVGPRRMIRRHLAERELGVAGDRRQRIVEIVGDAARQPPNRFHLLRLPELILEHPPLGEVLHGADHSQRPPLRVPQDAGLLVHPPHRAIRPHQAVLDVVRLPAGSCRLARRAHRGAVVRMDERQKGLRRSRELSERDAEDSVRFGGPAQAI